MTAFILLGGITFALPVSCRLTRRASVTAAGAAVTHHVLPSAVAHADQPTWGPFAGRSNAEIEALDEASRDPFAGYLLPSGVRVIDLIPGTGAEATVGKHVYVQYKVWANGFRNGVVADWSYIDGRPYDWLLGQPQRLPAGVDEGVRGMREGGWRRLVVPNAYGATGLRRINPVRGGGRTQPPAAGLLIQPGAFAWFDLVLVDGGSGRCEDVLSPLDMPAERAQKLRSLTCLPNEVSENFNIASGVTP